MSTEVPGEPPLTAEELALVPPPAQGGSYIFDPTDGSYTATAEPTPAEPD